MEKTPEEFIKTIFPQAKIVNVQGYIVNFGLEFIHEGQRYWAYGVDEKEVWENAQDLWLKYNSDKVY